MSPVPPRFEIRVAAALAAAAALVYLLASFGRDFWSPDEPDFAEHVREMIERHDYRVPYENGKPYGEKPILYYWAMAATTPFSGGDVHPGALRVPSVVSCAFLVFGAALLAGLRGGRREALFAGAATAVAPIVFWQGQFIQTDALFSALLLGALLAQVLIEEDPDRAGRWVLAFHLLLPLAVLTKGPLAIALTGLVAAVRSLLLRSWKPILGLKPFRGALIFVALVVPWYVVAARAGGPEYAYDLIVNQNWNRFFHAFDHIKPWWFYVESVWGDFFPTTLVAVLSPLVFRGSDVLKRRPEVRFAAVAALTMFLFLSTSQAKQGKYLLAAFPLTAVVAAAAVGELERRASLGLDWARRYAVLVAGIVFGAALALGPLAKVRAPQYAWMAPYLAVPLALGAVGTIVVYLRKSREAVPVFLALFATLAAGEAVTGVLVFRAVDTAKTGRPLYERIRPRLSNGEPLAYFGGTYHCYPILILRRKTEHFRNEKDLAAWVARTPDAHVLADRSEQAEWTEPALRSLVVLDRQRVGQDEGLLLGRR